MKSGIKNNNEGVPHGMGVDSKTLLIIGDSISVHYAPYLEQHLAGRIECVKKSGTGAALANLDVPLGANWGDSTMVRERLRKSKLLEAFSIDLALVNCGLHDIKRSVAGGECQVPLALHRANLEQIAAPFARAKIALTWATTTPVDDERHARLMKDFLRFDRDCLEYNAVADEVMRRRNVPMIDLYEFTKLLGPGIFEDHVHFMPLIRGKQAQFIANRLLAWRSKA